MEVAIRHDLTGLLKGGKQMMFVMSDKDYYQIWIEDQGEQGSVFDKTFEWGYNCRYH